MAGERRKIGLGFTSDRISEGSHICYIFHDEQERRRVTAKYLQSGILDGEKLLYLADSITPAEMRQSLEELGVDIRPASLVADAATSGYCPTGCFGGTQTLEMVRAFEQQAREEGYQGCRGAGEMSWALVEGRVTREALLEYEARLNLLQLDCTFTSCCQYDARRFDGETIMDVLSTHPLMIVRGQLVRNPLYIEPAQFLAELRARSGKADQAHVVA